MSIAMATLSQAAIADATGQAGKKVPPNRQTVVAATTTLVPLPR